MKYTVDGLGNIGMITDVDSAVLPPNAWDFLLNVRCVNGHIEPMDKYTDITSWSNVGTKDVYAHALGTLATATSYELVYPYDDDGDGACEAIYTYDGSTDTDITRTGSAYTASANAIWNTCSFNGLVIINSGEDAAQYWSGTGLCLDMPWDATHDWNNTAGGTETYRAKVIRAYKQMLVAFDIDDNGTRYDQMIHWSAIADPGSAPYWDYATTTNASGRTSLAETGGRVLDGIQLGQSFVIFKEDAIHIANFVNNAFVLDIEPQDTTHGLWCANAVTNIGGLLVVLGDGVVYTFDGQNTTDILTGKNAEDFFKQIDPTNYDRCFVAHKKSLTEVWFCFPEIGQDWPSRALVWQYRADTWSYRTLPPCSTIQEGYISSSDADAWDDASETTLSWDDEHERAWEERTYSPIADVLIAAGEQLIEFDTGVTTDPVEATKTNIVMGDDPELWYLAREFWPYATGGPFEVTVGTQDYIDGPVTWKQTQTFTPGVQKKLDLRNNGTVQAIKITHPVGGEEPWTLNRYKVVGTETAQR